jgi:hypothetical protein
MLKKRSSKKVHKTWWGVADLILVPLRFDIDDFGSFKGESMRGVAVNAFVVIYSLS